MKHWEASQTPDMRSPALCMPNGGAMRERLNKLHNEDKLSWRKIAQMDEYKGIPAGSLCSYASGTWEPKTERSRRMFNLPTVEVVLQARGKLGRFVERRG